MVLLRRLRVVLSNILGTCSAFVCLAQPLPPRPQIPAIQSDVRHYYLDSLTKMPTYAPGKNSFLFQNLHRGDRRTVLNLEGSGSVRHIWATWSTPGDDSDVPLPGRILARVFVDGEVQPSISAPIDDLCRAAANTRAQFLPFPAFNYKGAFNFYLNIFFRHGIRVDIEATDEISEFYAQIDYRTQAIEESNARLVGRKTDKGLTLKYVDGDPSWHRDEATRSSTTHETAILDYTATKPGALTIEGPGVLRELSFRTQALASLTLEIFWDDDVTPSVEAPMEYFFGNFVNVAMESITEQSTVYFPMPFRKKARILIRGLSGKAGKVQVDYSVSPGPVPLDALYFHALFREEPRTTGFSQFSVLYTMGEGLFVGMNLFDSGHNHGGGDAALIDAGTVEPRVLHGICGEDYFGFAWHHTGTMTPLTGAPIHERRYRLHLENPYPFRNSIQFLFGIFGGQHPKSVAFWYQRSGLGPETTWATFDVPWKILGPLSGEAQPPNSVTDESYATVVPINEPVKMDEKWQDANMIAGFLDATYQFRHYVMVQKGTGFVAGASKSVMITYVYAPSRRNLEVLLGHDDRTIVIMNNRSVADEPAHRGFVASRLRLRLHSGWNKLRLVVYNDENVTWRWCGISLAFDRSHVAGIRFSSRQSGPIAAKSCWQSSLGELSCLGPGTPRRLGL